MTSPRRWSRFALCLIAAVCMVAAVGLGCFPLVASRGSARVISTEVRQKLIVHPDSEGTIGATESRDVLLHRVAIVDRQGREVGAGFAESIPSGEDGICVRYLPVLPRVFVFEANFSASLCGIGSATLGLLALALFAVGTAVGRGSENDSAGRSPRPPAFWET